MKERFYAGFTLQKDLELVEIIEELKGNPQVIILHEPEKFLVHEMRYVNNMNHDRVDTGITHIGYDYHYVVFLYRGNIVSVEASMYYPFTDVNHPGKFNFVIYKRVGLYERKQVSYVFAYTGLQSIDNWLSKRPTPYIHTRVKVHEQKLFYEITSNMQTALENAVKTKGAYRERSVFEDTPVIIPTETWNDEHKVVEVIAGTVDESGHRDSFLFDCMTGKFC